MVVLEVSGALSFGSSWAVEEFDAASLSDSLDSSSSILIRRGILNFIVFGHLYEYFCKELDNF